MPSGQSPEDRCSHSRPGEVVDKGALIAEIDFAPLRMRVSTERYASPEWNARERERLWMRVWQVAGRADEIPNAGDWKLHRIFDQSFVIVRGRDGVARGFVNACAHRGNAFCTRDKGNSPRFLCPYHNWSYGLDGQVLGVARPDFKGSIEEFVGEKSTLGLTRVPVEEFAGFLWINPDPDASSLAEYMGEIMDLLAPYRMEEMTPVGLDVRETIACNWKVVIDAFSEGYHIQGVHPELIPAMDESKERYRFFGDHSVATAPFGAANLENYGPEQEVEAIHVLPMVFPGVTDVLPRFDELVAGYRGADGVLTFPEGVTGRLLLQQATREWLMAKGLDVSGLTDVQMSDNHFYTIFPNFFLTIRAGEATLIVPVPHSSGDPNRCVWHVTGFMWLPPEQRAAARVERLDVAEGDHYTYFLPLEQDFEQMQHQQDGLRNTRNRCMNLTKQEVRLAFFHSVLDSWVDGARS